MNNTLISNIIKSSFSFLIEQCECQIISEESDVFGVYVTYTSKEAGLRVSYEPREGGAFVMIFPLLEGEIPKYSGNWHDFQDFLEVVRGTQFNKSRIRIQDCYNPDPAILLQTFEGYACLVRKHLSDYLAGDFAVTTELKAIVKRRRDDFRRSQK